MEGAVRVLLAACLSPISPSIYGPLLERGTALNSEAEANCRCFWHSGHLSSLELPGMAPSLLFLLFSAPRLIELPYLSRVAVILWAASRCLEFGWTAIEPRATRLLHAAEDFMETVACVGSD